MRLSELNTGEKGVIVKVLGHGGFRRRIVEMGFIKGKTVEVMLNAPLNDPIKYKILGYEVSLRRQEAGMVQVISEEEAKEYCHHPRHRHLQHRHRILETFTNKETWEHRARIVALLSEEDAEEMNSRRGRFRGGRMRKLIAHDS